MNIDRDDIGVPFLYRSDNFFLLEKQFLSFQKRMIKLLFNSQHVEIL